MKTTQLIIVNMVRVAGIVSAASLDGIVAIPPVMSWAVW